MSQTLLIDERPILFQPSLARLLGINGAIAVQQLHFLLGVPKNGRELNGERWIYNTYEEWQRDHFPFWSIPTIKRTFLDLEEIFVVVSEQMEGRHSRRKYYRLNKGMILKLTKDAADEINLIPSEKQADHGIKLIRSGKGSKRSDGRDQIDPFLATETSSEKRLLSAEKKKSAVACSRREIPSMASALAYGDTLNLSDEDSANFHNYYSGFGWETKGTPIRDWKAVMRRWRSANELKAGKPAPSFKTLHQEPHP